MFIESIGFNQRRFQGLVLNPIFDSVFDDFEVVRERCFELIPIQPLPPAEEAKKKRSVITSTNANMVKTKRVSWELVAAVEVPPNSEQRANGLPSKTTIAIYQPFGFSPSYCAHHLTEWHFPGTESAHN